jgi:hypothetical protein
MRGVSSVANVGMECGGRGRLARRARWPADAEVVWFWHPWAGAKPCETFRRATVTNKVMDTGESTKDAVKTIAQGMSVF